MAAQRRSLWTYFSTLEEKFRIFKCEDIMFSRKSSRGISLLFYIIIKLYFLTIANGSVISCCNWVIWRGFHRYQQLTSTNENWLVESHFCLLDMHTPAKSIVIYQQERRLNLKDLKDSEGRWTFSLLLLFFLFLVFFLFCTCTFSLIYFYPI